MQAALELQGDPLPPGERRIGIHRTQGVIGDGQRLGIAQDRAIPPDDRHVIGEEGAGVVVHRAQDRGGLARIGARRHQDCPSIHGNTRRMDQGITLAHKTPAQDRFDHVGVKDMRGKLQDL